MDELRPAILINNAGGGGHLPPHFPEATIEAWTHSLALNLRAPMLATQHMRAACRSIVNIASSAGRRRRAARLPGVQRRQGGPDPLLDRRADAQACA